MRCSGRQRERVRDSFGRVEKASERAEMVLDAGFEPATPTMSMWCSTPELTERSEGKESLKGGWFACNSFFEGDLNEIDRVGVCS